LVAVSAELGVAKPAPGFFTTCSSEPGCAAGRDAYVGDQLDNECLAADAVDLRDGARVLTGPWVSCLRDDAVEALLAVHRQVAALPAWLRR